MTYYKSHLYVLNIYIKKNWLWKVKVSQESMAMILILIAFIYVPKSNIKKIIINYINDTPCYTWTRVFAQVFFAVHILIAWNSDHLYLQPHNILTASKQKYFRSNCWKYLFIQLISFGTFCMKFWPDIYNLVINHSLFLLCQSRRTAKIRMFAPGITVGSSSPGFKMWTTNMIKSR